MISENHFRSIALFLCNCVHMQVKLPTAGEPYNVVKCPLSSIKQRNSWSTSPTYPRAASHLYQNHTTSLFSIQAAFFYGLSRDDSKNIRTACNNMCIYGVDSKIRRELSFYYLLFPHFYAVCGSNTMDQV